MINKYSPRKFKWLKINKEMRPITLGSLVTKNYPSNKVCFFLYHTGKFLIRAITSIGENVEEKAVSTNLLRCKHLSDLSEKSNLLENY